MTDQQPLVLLIDDEELVRQMLTSALELGGYRVITAADGVEGLRMYQQHKPQVVVTDILMPEKEGIETIMEMRRDGDDTRIVAISGGDRSGSELFLEVAGRLGADRTLAKPFRPKELLTVISELLAA